MTAYQEGILIISILIINTLVAATYLIYGFYYNKRHPDESFVKYIILSIFMFFCPIVGAVFLGLGNLFYHIFFDSSIDLAAITFSKERVNVLDRPDEADEINLIPMEEAIMINDKENLRNLLLTVLKGDVSKSINAVTKALNSADSEASHYAASAIMDIVNDFQTTLQKFHAQLEANPNDTEINVLYINYLEEMLAANFLSELELKTYVYTLLEVCQNLYEQDKAALRTTHYTGLISLLTRIGDLQAAELWISRYTEAYPDELEMYRCVLHHYFAIKDKIHFFACLDKLKNSSIAVDNDMLELIRTFNS